MVEIEEHCHRIYGLWIDGNRPSGNLVQAMMLSTDLKKRGITADLQQKHQLNDYKTKLKMNTNKRWEHLLSAQLECEILALNANPDNFTEFLIEPKYAKENNKFPFLVKGITPSDSYKYSGPRRRSTYIHTFILAPESQGKTAYQAMLRTLDILHFKFTRTSMYEDYRNFEKECREFLRKTIKTYDDKIAYEMFMNNSGITINRIFPESSIECHSF
jgi:hypothetical protein